MGRILLQFLGREILAIFLAKREVSSRFCGDVEVKGVATEATEAKWWAFFVEIEEEAETGAVNSVGTTVGDIDGAVIAESS
jgi:hypothetical protein